MRLLLLLSIVVAAQSQYAPEYGSCPQDLSIRAASNGLSYKERTWRQKRLANVVDSVKDYLPRANISGFDTSAYLAKLDASNVPVSSFVVSGGGAVSGMGGLGVWQAFDSRYAGAVNAGTGGLTQCFTYISGLSGGGYLSTASLATNNFSSIQELRKNINFGTDYVTGPSGNSTEYFTTLFENTADKAELGFPVSVADIFGMFWTVYYPQEWWYRDWSDIANFENTSFAMGVAPMPILSMAEVLPTSPNYMGIQSPGFNNINLTLYEATPFEFGSWRGGRVQAFIDTQYLGTEMSNGKPLNSSECVTGFDKVTFIAGSTADAFNGYLIDAVSNDTVSAFAKRDIVLPSYVEDNPLVQLVQAVSEVFNQSLNASLWATYPNPFNNYNNEMQNNENLYLVDGSETGQTIAFWPVIQEERQVDFIVAVDGSTDFVYSWVNGTEIVDTATVAKQGNISFPSVPDQATFVNYGLNKFPTFFGCEADYDGPLVLYLPDAPWSGYTNYSYTQTNFTNNQVDIIFENWFNVATFGNGTLDSEWPACVGCALIKRSLKRFNMSLPDTCASCFSRHCWNGTTDDSTPSPYNPNLILGGLDFSEWNSTVFNR